jgi:hypothetical protein
VSERASVCALFCVCVCVCAHTRVLVYFATVSNGRIGD